MFGSKPDILPRPNMLEEGGTIQYLKEGNEINIPNELLAKMTYQESRFGKHTLSPAGARGFAQFMPGT